jgi:hypothetical protein
VPAAAQPAVPRVGQRTVVDQRHEQVESPPRRTQPVVGAAAEPQQVGAQATQRILRGHRAQPWLGRQAAANVVGGEVDVAVLRRAPTVPDEAVPEPGRHEQQLPGPQLDRLGGGDCGVPAHHPDEFVVVEHPFGKLRTRWVVGEGRSVHGACTSRQGLMAVEHSA